MIRHTSGLVCVAVDDETADRLNLPLMVSSKGERGHAMKTAFTVSCDLVKSTTGISAGERAATIARLGPRRCADEFVRPGHVFPCATARAACSGARGHPEAAYDLSTLAGCGPAGVLCEIVNDSDGSMARLPQLQEFSEKHGLKMVLISDLVRYRRKRQALVEGPASARVPTDHGEFTAVSYRSKLDGIEHVAFVYGDDADAVSQDNVLVRVLASASPGISSTPQVRLRQPVGHGDEEVAAEGRGASSLASGGRRAVASASGTSSARTTCRMRAGTPCRQTRISASPWIAVRGGSADPSGPGREDHQAHDQQPGQVPRPQGIRPDGRRPALRPDHLGQQEVHRDQEEGEDGSHVWGRERRVQRRAGGGGGDRGRAGGGRAGVEVI